MTDLEIIRLCAEAMEAPPTLPGSSEIWGVKVQIAPEHKVTTWVRGAYDPFHNDAQAMALLLMLLSSGAHIVIENNERGTAPILVMGNTVYPIRSAELFRRAIVNCVATIQQEKHG